jgi:flagellar basal-body rod protein FlgG
VPTGLQLGLGTRTSSNEILFTQGSFSQTDNPLDMVIQGKGFFQIRRASGELAYTRSGAFHLDKDGSLVTQDGNPLEPQITLPSAPQISSGGMERSATLSNPAATQSQPR